MKLLGVIRDKNYCKYLHCGLDGFLFPLNGFSCDYECTYSIDEIKSFQKEYPLASCFVVMNKMVYNHEISHLLETLEELETMQVSGVLFYDTSILYLTKENSLNLPLYLHQTHFVTNKQMIQEYCRLGSKGAYLSNEITKDEMLKIADNVDAKLMMLLVGYPVVAMSRRKLVTNYFKNIKKPYQDKIEVVENVSGQKYFVKETNEGTTFTYGKRVNHSCCYSLLCDKISYGIICQDELDSDTYATLICSFKNFNQQKIDEIAGHNRGFLYRKTIYQVKRK